MSDKGILLLGGAGFIGRALANRLRHEDKTVHRIGRHNLDLLERTLPQCSTVIHLATASTPGSSARHPELELPNIALTLDLLERLKKRPEIHLIFFSSGGTVYGNSSRTLVSEDTPLSPLSNHGAGKVAQEAFCQVLRAEGHAVTILRPSNAYGPGQTLHQGFGLVRTLLEHVRCGTSPEIWGDGENVRDFIYIDDIVEATVRLIDLPQDSGTYNLGSGVGYSINQVLKRIESICGKKLEVIFHAARSIDVQSIVLDSSRLNDRLGLQEKIELPEGIARTWEWLQREGT